MKTVEIYIGTDLRGPARGTGKVIYIMRTLLQSDQYYESQPAVRSEEDATESHMVLLALRDAIKRINYACEVVIYMECTYVAAAVNNMWPVAWRDNNWQTARGAAKDVDLWQDILYELEVAGHILKAVSGKHEFCDWMRSNMPRLAANTNAFTAVEQKVVSLVNDRMPVR